jgi:DNA anti-recombination protein RmuC
MGLGGTAKKLQKVADMGEELYKRINDLRAQVAEMRETVTATHERVDRLESEVAEQRAILGALAEAEGIDLDAVVAEAHISEAEAAAGDDAGTTESTATADATETAEPGDDSGATPGTERDSSDDES